MDETPIGGRPVPPLPAIRYTRTQRDAEALVAEAVADWPPLPGLSMRANAVRLLASMYHVHGSTRFPRGWVRPAMIAFIDAGVDCPNARCWRSYRSDVQENPGGFTVTDQHLIRYLPPVLLGFLAGFFGPTGYWAPWRVVWRLIPALNGWLPDLNGVWLGTTGSNWPTIKKMLDGAQAYSVIDKEELHSTQEQVDAMAVQVTASLFRLKVAAGLSSTDGRSHSITAKPHRDQHSGRIHLTYVYEQTSPNPAITDEERHMGAADLTIDPDNLDVAEGVYWTRRNWQIGLNTAGRLELRRSTQRKEKGKSLRQYAAEEKKRLEVES